MLHFMLVVSLSSIIVAVFLVNLASLGLMTVKSSSNLIGTRQFQRIELNHLKQTLIL